MTIRIPKSICVFVGLLGFATYGVTAAIDIYYGHAMTVSKGGETLQPIAMVIVSGAAFAFACIAGAFARGRHWIAAAGAFVLACGFLSYTALNGVGFFASESLGKSRVVAAKNKQAQDVVSLTNQQAIENRKGVIDWLKSTYTTKAPVAEKERITEKVLELSNQPIPLKTIEVDAVIADARSEVMSEFLGLKIESAQVINAVWLTGLLIIAKLFCPSLAIGLWPKPDFGEKTQNGNPYGPEGKSQNSTGRPKDQNKDDGLVDVIELHAAGQGPLTIPFLATRWGISNEAVRYRFRDWEAKREIELGRHNNRLYVRRILKRNSNVIPMKSSA